MTDGDADATGHLRRQHAMLLDRIGRLQRMAAAVEKAMEARTMGINLTPEERFEVFGDFDPDEYAAEVEERWGDTDAYRESQRARGALHEGRLAAHQGRRARRRSSRSSRR